MPWAASPWSAAQTSTCGACKTLLITGEVDMKPYAHFALTDAERAAGYILACRALPLADCDVAIADGSEETLNPGAPA